MKVIIVFLFSLSVLIYPQQKDVKFPDYYKIDKSLSDSLLSIVKSVGLDSNYDAGEDGVEQISFAVIDLNSDPAELGGVNSDNLIYPASVYKMYVAASILKQISEGKFSLPCT